MGQRIEAFINSKPTQMKKELFNLLVKRILAQPDLFSTHKVTIKEGLEVHTFGNVRNTDLAEAKQLFREKGYKMDDVRTEAVQLSGQNKLTNWYLTILYGAEKDKISISTFEMGYGPAYRKNRYYPVRKNNPVVAYTKHMYGFKRVRKGRSPVRIQLGSIYVPNFGTDISEIITKTMLGIDYIPKAMVSYRHILNTKNDMQALSNMFGVKVPDALKQFSTHEVVKLYKTIKDYNQINKLCQFMAKNEDHSDELWACIAEMLFDNVGLTWLVADSINDNLKAKKRNISLAVTSEKRWRDEHQKAARAEMIKGIPEIKVEETFKKALEGLEHPYELIETKERLVQESVELHHCVATYADKINRGQCAIFSILFEEKRYTLEVRNNAVGDDIVFTPVQFRGLCNESAPEVIGKRVAEVLALNKFKNPNVNWKHKQETADVLEF